MTTVHLFFKGVSSSSDRRKKKLSDIGMVMERAPVDNFLSYEFHFFLLLKNTVNMATAFGCIAN